MDHAVLGTAVVQGAVRADRNTKRLLRNIARGEIALICHTDLDEPAAEGLLRAGVKAVVNAGRTMTGTFPHKGPLSLIRGRIPIFEIGESRFDEAADAEHVAIGAGRLVGRHADIPCAPFGYKDWERLNRAAERNFRHTLWGFAENTLKRAEQELETLFRPLSLPELRKPIRSNEVLIVARGSGYKDDLTALRPYIADARPVLIGVDGGADALTEQGYRPDLIIGDMDSVSDETLRCGAQLLVHAYVDGRAPGLERVRSLGLYSDIVAAPGTSEDIAMRLAYEREAARIVIVGSHSHPVDFLEKGRAGMASTLLVRMLVGHKLVDAKGASLWLRRKHALRTLALPALAEGGALRWNPYR
ncbi:putative cytokinetic ring protein SteA [Paenibacillus sp. GYB003]|uniref:putative cytokinetic ring protein SteA n=1 Tax=Paenibacillus sp. GYB003 TaxID=2994392 RepID=UPI002F9692A3